MEVLGSIEAGDRSESALDFVRCRISDDDLTRIAAALAGRTGIKLMLEGNLLTDRSAAALAALLAADVVEVLVLAHNSLSSAGVIELAGGLAKNSSLLELDLTYVKVDDEGIEAVAEALHGHAALRVLKLFKCQLGDDGIHALVTALGQSNRSVQILDIGSNRFGSDVIPGVAYALQANVLLSLGLRGNDLRPTDAAVLAEALQENTALQELDLRKNKLADSGCVHMASMLAVNKTLVSIDLRANKIADRGYGALVKALRVNTSLYYLDLAGNGGAFEAFGEEIQGHLTKNSLLPEAPDASAAAATDGVEVEIAQAARQIEALSAELVAKSQLVDQIVANVGVDNAAVKASAVLSKASMELEARKAMAEIQRAHEQMDLQRSKAEEEIGRYKRQVAELEASLQALPSNPPAVVLAAAAARVPPPTSRHKQVDIRVEWTTFGMGFAAGVAAVAAGVVTGLLRLPIRR